MAQGTRMERAADAHPGTGDGDAFRDFFEHLSDMALMADAQGGIVHANRAWETSLGWAPEQLGGRALSDFLHPEDVPALAAALREPGEAGATVTARFRHGAGGFRRLDWRLSASAAGKAESGAFMYLIARELARPEEPGLPLSPPDLRRLGDVAHYMTNLLVITDTQHRIVWVNPAFEARTGYALAEAVGRNPGELTRCPDTDPETVARIGAALDAGRPVRAEILNRSRSGEHYWVDVNIHPQFDTAGEPIGFISIETDITAHKAVEEEALRARERLSATLAAVPELIADVDAEGRYRGYHAGANGSFPFRSDQVVGRSLEEVLPAETAAERREMMREVELHGGTASRLSRVRLPEGEYWLEVTAALRPGEASEDGPGYLFVLRDVTDRVRAEEALRYRESLLKGLFELSPIGLALNDLETGEFVDVNAALLAPTGYSREELLDLSYWDITPPEYAEMEAQALQQLRESGRYGPFEKEYIRKDGSRYPVLLNGIAVVDGAGRRLIWSLIDDISERKAREVEREIAARAATEARERLMAAVEALPDAFVYYDADDRLVLCNARYREFYPQMAEMMVPGARFEDIVRAGLERGVYRVKPGDEEDWLQRSLDAHAGDGKDLEVPLADGRWLRMIDKPTADGGRVGMRQDITALKHAERRLADIIHGSEAGTWEWHLPSGRNIINERWAEIAGYTLEELGEPTIELWHSLCHPDDLARAEKRLERVLAGEVAQFEYLLRMRHKAGHWVWVQSRGRVARRAADGTPELMAGVHLDVTPLKEAEQRLEDIIAGAQVGTWQFDVCGGFSRINDRWAEMLGYRRADFEPLRRDALRRLVHPEDSARLESGDAALIRGESTQFETEMRMRHADGQWVWVLSRGRVTARDTSGEALEISGVHLDITERKKLEATLTAERDYLALLMETSIAGILAHDAQGRIIFANSEAERILGLRRSEGDDGYDTPLWRITGLDRSPYPNDERPIHKVVNSGGPVRDLRLAIEWPDGGRRFLSVNAAPIDSPAMRASVVSSITDITAQVEGEEALRKSAARAEAASEAKSHFLANISHEIRTPLNGVLGMAEVLEDALSEESQKRMIRSIRASGEVLLATLNDVLDMSKIEAGKLAMERIAFTPADLASQVTALHGLGAQEEGLELVVTASEGAKSPRQGDPHRILQILNNLVSNAIKFTERGSVRVTIGGAPAEPLRIEVRDTGIGMTPEQANRVFEAFEQADGSVSRRFGGTGLGMSIVRRLVSIMGGRISVESAPGEGTAILIELPLPEAETVPARGKAAKATAPEADLSGRRVLAADDNATNRKLLQLMLERRGAEVTLVANGREAIEAWAPERFDVLLLDISMPDIDGVTALREIRDRAADARVPAPALAITAHAMAHQVAEYRASGFDGHVGKPFRGGDLARAITEVLGQAAPD